MKKSIFFTTLFILLAACAAPPAPTLTPDTPPLKLPATSPPAPTQTPTPEAQLPAEVVEKFTEEQLDQMTDEEKLAIGPELEGHNKWRASGKYVIYADQYGNIDKAYDLSKGEYRDIPDYPVTKPENFRDNEISVEDLLNGNYFLSLNKLSRPFNSEKIKFVNFDTVTSTGTLTVVYDRSTAPNYENPDERPFRRDVTSAVVRYGDIDYLVAPIEYANPAFPSDPSKNVWVIGIYPMGMLDGGPLPAGKEERLLDVYLHGMNIPALLVGYEFSAGEIPLTKHAWEQNGIEKMKQRMVDFISGDISKLDGYVVNIITGRTKDQNTIQAPDYYK